MLLIAGGLALIVEMLAHWGLRSVEGSSMKTFGIVYDSKTWKPWTAAIVAVVVGGWLVRSIWPRVASQWDKAQAVAREKGLAA